MQNLIVGAILNHDIVEFHLPMLGAILIVHIPQTVPLPAFVVRSFPLSMRKATSCTVSSISSFDDPQLYYPPDTSLITPIRLSVRIIGNVVIVIVGLELRIDSLLDSWYNLFTFGGWQGSVEWWVDMHIKMCDSRQIPLVMFLTSIHYSHSHHDIYTV